MHIEDVKAIATETTLESAARTMSNGRTLAMNSHSRLGFTLDEVQTQLIKRDQQISNAAEARSSAGGNS